MFQIFKKEKHEKTGLKINSLLKTKNEKEMHVVEIFYKHLTSIYMFIYYVYRRISIL